MKLTPLLFALLASTSAVHAGFGPVGSDYEACMEKSALAEGQCVARCKLSNPGRCRTSRPGGGGGLSPASPLVIECDDPNANELCLSACDRGANSLQNACKTKFNNPKFP